MKTTREKAKEHNHDKLVDNLQELLEKNYDAETKRYSRSAFAAKRQVGTNMKKN